MARRHGNEMSVLKFSPNRLKVVFFTNRKTQQLGTNFLSQSIDMLRNGVSAVLIQKKNAENKDCAI